MVYTAEDSGKPSASAIKQMGNLRAAGELQLKVGAQVMLTINIPKLGLCNGSRGLVVGFSAGGDGADGGTGDGGGGAAVSAPASPSAAGSAPVPIILFTSGVSGATTKKVAIQRAKLPFDGETKGAYRRQLPLKLAWVSRVRRF